MVVWVCVQVHMYCMYMWKSGQLWGIGSFFPLC